MCKDIWNVDCGVLGESTICRTKVQLWYNRFTEGREVFNDDAQPGRPSMSTTDKNTEAVKKMILDNRRITIREVAGDVGNFYGCFRAEKCGSKYCSKIAKFLANTTSHGYRSEDVREDDPDLHKKVITGDESCVYGYDIETKAQLSQWKRPEEQKTEKITSSLVKCEGFAHCYLRL